MARLNKFIGIGNLTRDPEIRTLAGGSTVTKLGVAINNSRKDKATGQWIDEPVFLDCEIWDSDKLKRSEYISQNCKKGTAVLIDGALRRESWKDQQGNNREKITCRLDNIQLVGRSEKSESAPAEQPRQAPQQEQQPEYNDDRIPF